MGLLGRPQRLTPRRRLILYLDASRLDMALATPFGSDAGALFAAGLVVPVGPGLARKTRAFPPPRLWGKPEGAPSGFLGGVGASGHAAGGALPRSRKG